MAAEVEAAVAEAVAVVVAAVGVAVAAVALVEAAAVAEVVEVWVRVRPPEAHLRQSIREKPDRRVPPRCCAPVARVNEAAAA